MYPRPSVTNADPSLKYAAASPSPIANLAVVKIDGNADGRRSRQNTSHGRASTLASSSRAAGSADFMPPTTPKVKTGNEVNATMNSTVGSPPPSHSTTDVMYATHGVTSTSTRTGWVASSTNRDEAISDPTTTASSSEIDKPTTTCQPVTTALLQ